MLLRALVYCLFAGFVFACARAQTIVPNSDLVWRSLQGFVLAAAFRPVARWGPRLRLRLVMVIWTILAVVGGFAMLSDMLIIVKIPLFKVLITLRDDLLAFTALTIALVFLAAPLRIIDSSAGGVPTRLNFVSLVWRVVVCGLVYLVLFFVFGAIVYFLVTKPYYQEHALLRTAEEAVLSLGLWWPLIQVARGILMVAASVPLIFFLRTSRRNAAIIVGIILWTVGGLSPLLIPSQHVPALLMRFSHTIEILCQNGGLGIVAVWLLRPKETLSS